jgi:hypothetical protein
MGPVATANPYSKLPLHFQLKFEFFVNVNYRPTDSLASSK